MKTLIQRAYGPVASSVRIEETRLPTPASGEVCVRVRYAGLNPLDWKLVEGHYKWMSKSRPPCGVGFELAGEVHDAGRGSARFTGGMPVAGLIPAFQRPPGAIAQFALVPAALLVPVPAGIALEQAAALPVAGLSALQMCRMAEVRPGARVLVHGASGGVGHLAAQIARNLGAVVTATARVESHAMLRALAADLQPVDRNAPVDAWGGPFDAVLDGPAALGSADLRTLLAPAGHYVATTPRFPQVVADTVFNLFRRGQRRVLMLKPSGADLATLMQQLAGGELRVAIDRVVPFAEAAQALAALRGGGVRGKVVVAID